MGHTGEVSAAKFDGTGRRVISGGVDHMVKVWNVSDGDCFAVLKGPSKTVIDVNISLDSSMASSSGTDSAIYVWSLKSQKIHLHLTGHRSKVTSALFSLDSRSIVSFVDFTN